MRIMSFAQFGLRHHSENIFFLLHSESHHLDFQFEITVEALCGQT